MDTRACVQAVVDGILSGEILATFDKYYADDVIMSENGTGPRVGKAVNREYEVKFVESMEFHGAEVGTILIDGNMAAVEWTFDVTPKDGERMKMRQVALQTWNDGKIEREVFYHP